MDVTRRDMALGALALSAAPLVGQTRLAAQASLGKDPLWFVNPELRPAAKAMQHTGATFPSFSLESLPMMRKGLGGFSRPPRTDISYRKEVIPGPHGAPQLTIYVVNAKPGARRGGILHTHGGGYVAGSAQSSIADLQDVAKELDCAIVTVEYRLAPETSWKGSLEDNYSALKWLQRQADELGVDQGRIAVMGESAGGGHAALLAIAARDRGEVQLVFQCLTYPMLDDRTASTRAVPAPIGSILWDGAANRFGWRSFLGQEPGGASIPVAAVPARTEQLAGLPPAWIGTGSIDLFVSEDIDYARRLIEAGVSTELTVVPGAYHGFDVFAADTSVAKGFYASKIEALRQKLSNN